jgi:probable rRNA maturation factor
MDDDDHLAAGDLPAEEPDRAWPKVLISNRQNLPVDEEGLRELAGDTLRGEGIERAELSVSFVDGVEMAELHERFMDQPGPTDVLSFPLDDADEAKGREGVRLLGDVVVAPTEAERNNPGDADGELRLLVVHGILHLLGYDHEEDGARTRMWERQERYSGVRAP